MPPRVCASGEAGGVRKLYHVEIIKIMQSLVCELWNVAACSLSVVYMLDLHGCWAMQNCCGLLRGADIMNCGPHRRGKISVKLQLWGLAWLRRCWEKGIEAEI